MVEQIRREYRCAGKMAQLILKLVQSVERMADEKQKRRDLAMAQMMTEQIWREHRCVEYLVHLILKAMH